ncbi:MAG TPA: NUDIX hydrolase [Candidatus Saccharimonadales bacterium]|nr:NUDIX hydrolase [Candidatus Saccharimonadales bacterium]
MERLIIKPTTQPSIHPNTFYRVSVKALILNDEGEVLVLKEDQDEWSLPGGGLDHGEAPADGLRREVFEELGLEVRFGQPLLTKSFYLPGKKAWLLWVVYQAQLSKNTQWRFGKGVTDVKFINSAELRSDALFESLVKQVVHEAHDARQE